MSKPHRLSASVLYDILADFDDMPNPHDHDRLDRAAISKLLRLGYLRPSRFGDTENVFGRRPVLAYVVTPEGREFIHRHEEACAIRDGRLVGSEWAS